MNISSTPPSARTDVQAAPSASGPAISTGAIRTVGVVLTVGTLASATAAAVVGFDPGTERGILAYDLTGLLFQGGLVGLVHVHLATGATGTTRRSRWLLQVERVLLVLAIGWTLCHALLPSQRDATWLAVLDFSWPLSMLGLFLIGVTIAVKGRWRGPARAWALLAETWVVVTIPALGLLGQTAGTAVGVAHLVLGYAVLGAILAARPDLVADRAS